LPKPTHSRSAIRRTILTSKTPATFRSARERRYKEKLERELVVAGSPKGWNELLRSLGLRPGFRYDKFRSTFSLRRFPGLAIELDETPAGTFLELEGLPRAIDHAARALGYSSRDYYGGSYWDVYAADCRRRGITPRNMVFDKQK
jgi:adenylate cyclase class IV